VPNRHIDDAIKIAAIEEIRNGIPRHDVSVQYGVSKATLSRWAKAAGIESEAPPRGARSRPLKKSDAEKYANERMEMLKKGIRLTNEMLSQGGLSTADVRNLSQAARTLNDAYERAEKVQAELEREKKKKEVRVYPVGLGEMYINENDPDPSTQQLLSEFKAEEEEGDEELRWQEFNAAMERRRNARPPGDPGRQ
jgi:hypothetical protein